MKCWREDGDVLKNPDHQNPEKVLDHIKKIENMAGQAAFDIERPQDIKVNIRVDEKIGPAKFRPDPLIPNGYIANSLTIRAMRADIFVLGESLEDLVFNYQCSCGKEFDLQFWKLCPFCGKDIKP